MIQTGIAYIMAHMSVAPVALAIENWFAEQGDDGEFTRQARDVPYSIVPPADADARVICSTKPSSLLIAFGEAQHAVSFGLIGRYGLPCAGDAQWLSNIGGQSPILFLGDCDPADLMIFAWLRAQLPRGRITYVGVSDDLLRLLAIEIIDSLEIPCSESECRAVPVLSQVLPDFRELVGIESARRLGDGRKIELDAVVSGAGGAVALLRSIASGDP